MNKDSKLRKACVIGWPVAHSLSPIIHQYWMKEHGVDGAYEAIAVDHGDLEDFIHSLRAGEMAGANVTIPHKQAVLRLVDVVDPAARAIGAVNTIVARPDGSLHGLNTDGDGFLNWLRQAVPDWQAADTTVLVLGAGGAARAIIVALLGAGVARLRLANRSAEHAGALEKDITDPRLTLVPWEDRSNATAGAGLLVNATALGMIAMPPLEIDLGGLREGAVVYDIVYAPLETELLRQAAAAGYGVVDGLGMLCHQAALAFEAWFGILPVVDEELRARLERAISDAGRASREDR